MNQLRVLDLFSGIGGFSLGLERAGMRTVAFCEIEEFPRKVLKKHWPEVPIYDDVRTLTAARLAADGIRVDVICGGFPCQPFSSASAGRGLGCNDDRYLWPEMFRLISECKPRFVIAENVTHLERVALRYVVSDLESIGYKVWVFEIPACAVGCDHRRNRLWVCCDSYRDSESSSTFNGKASRVRWDRSFPGEMGAKDGISYRMDRLKGLGNAVVPQIPELIGRAIIASHGAMNDHT